MNKATFKNFTVKATFKGDKKATWSDNNFNNNMVTITNNETKRRVSFEFWGNMMSPELKSEYDLLNAFYVFVCDAVSGTDNFESFCREFDYDNDSRAAEKIYNKCKKSTVKLLKIYDGDLYDLLNELGENYA